MHHARDEGVPTAFADDAFRTKFIGTRETSPCQKLGGKAAIDSAVGGFYVKVRADNRVNHFFEDVGMVKQHPERKEFFAAAFDGQVKVRLCFCPKSGYN